MNGGAANLAIRTLFFPRASSAFPQQPSGPAISAIPIRASPPRRLESIRTTSTGDTGDMMIKLIVRGRTWWMVRGCLYGSVADAIAARDA